MAKKRRGAIVPRDQNGINTTLGFTWWKSPKKLGRLSKRQRMQRAYPKATAEQLAKSAERDAVAKRQRQAAGGG